MRYGTFALAAWANHKNADTGCWYLSGGDRACDRELMLCLELYYGLCAAAAVNRGCRHASRLAQPLLASVATFDVDRLPSLDPHARDCCRSHVRRRGCERAPGCRQRRDIDNELFLLQARLQLPPRRTVLPLPRFGRSRPFRRHEPHDHRLLCILWLLEHHLCQPLGRHEPRDHRIRRLC